ncbi:response regulator [Thalassomonas actiniarum]|uniref:Response regulatory domain-containing protein n=1 Tax=Thalassomonas actiniarum TaxID=485447 RepID=A0AAF0C3P7_9GAMM|nr:response regulator [Thalassomonas actiniarum]WDE01422.1 hypothetical protein SG35_012775 [Thalassomonas actiniarum]
MSAAQTDSLYQHIPVIFVTARVEPEDLRRGFALGVADYITKPVNQDILLAREKNQQSCVRQLKLERQLLEESEKWQSWAIWWRVLPMK